MDYRPMVVVNPELIALDILEEIKETIYIYIAILSYILVSVYIVTYPRLLPPLTFVFQAFTKLHV